MIIEMMLEATGFGRSATRAKNNKSEDIIRNNRSGS